MNILYIFPHPDDESYGPSRAISRQKREGHKVFLLTLTKGGATKERHKFGYSVAEMGDIREKELRCAAERLMLDGLSIHDFPDGGLKALDPRILETAVCDAIVKFQPEIVLTYAVHGISLHADHLVTHAVVKRAFLELRESNEIDLKRLAFYTVPKRQNMPAHWLKRSNFSTTDEIDCIVNVNDVDRENFLNALSCYQTYRDRIEKSGIRKSKNKQVYFEIFQEYFDPPLDDLCDFKR